MIMLDTDILIDLIRGHPAALSWLGSLPVRPLVSGFAALELAFGSQNAVELANVSAFLAQFRILWPAEVEAAHSLEYARLKLSHGVGVLDALTAAIALRRRVPLGTFNVRHFGAIPGLATAQPYAR